MVLLEYMHAGLPFISYKTGDVVANIQHKIPESVVGNFNIEEWVKAIQLLSYNEELRLSLRKKMRTIIKQQYSEDSYYKQLDGIYQVILN